MANDRRRRVRIWIAILAILLNSFAPAISHALAASTPPSWMEICTEGGLAAAGAVRRQGDAPAKPGVTTVQHCPYCTPHGSSCGAPPAPGILTVASHIASQRIASAAAVAPARPVWRAHRSRGPPILRRAG